MASSIRSKNSSKQENAKDKNESSKQQTPKCVVANTSTSTHETESKILSELEKLRKGNMDGHSQTKLSLTKLEFSMQERKGEMIRLEKEPPRRRTASAPQKTTGGDTREQSGTCYTGRWT